MSIIDELLGSNGSQESGSVSQSDQSSSIDTSPSLEFGTGQVLGFSTAEYESDGSNGDHSASGSSLSVLDGLGFSAHAPIDTDFSHSSSSADYSESDSNGGGGGLLSGLL